MKKKLYKACDLLNVLRTDALMALSGEWNKSDGGFEAQIQLIEKYFDEIGFKYDEYTPEEDDEPESFFTENGIPVDMYI